MTVTELLCQPSRATDDLLIAAALIAETTQSVESTYETVPQYTLGHVNIDKKMHICRDVQKDAYVVYVTVFVYNALASVLVHLMKGQEMRNYYTETS